MRNDTLSAGTFPTHQQNDLHSNDDNTDYYVEEEDHNDWHQPHQNSSPATHHTKRTSSQRRRVLPGTPFFAMFEEHQGTSTTTKTNDEDSFSDSHSQEEPSSSSSLSSTSRTTSMGDSSEEEEQTHVTTKAVPQIGPASNSHHQEEKKNTTSSALTVPPKQKKQPTLYEILGASPTATRQELKHAYVQRAKLTHPDSQRQQQEQQHLLPESRSNTSSSLVSLRHTKNKQQPNKHDTEFHLLPAVAASFVDEHDTNNDLPDFGTVAAAYKVLADPLTRQRYDRTLQAQQFTNTVLQWMDGMARVLLEDVLKQEKNTNEQEQEEESQDAQDDWANVKLTTHTENQRTLSEIEDNVLMHDHSMNAATAAEEERVTLDDDNVTHNSFDFSGFGEDEIEKMKHESTDSTAPTSSLFSLESLTVNQTSTSPTITNTILSVEEEHDVEMKDQRPANSNSDDNAETSSLFENPSLLGTIQEKDIFSAFEHEDDLSSPPAKKKRKNELTQDNEQSTNPSHTIPVEEFSQTRQPLHSKARELRERAEEERSKIEKIRKQILQKDHISSAPAPSVAAKKNTRRSKAFFRDIADADDDDAAVASLILFTAQQAHSILNTLQTAATYSAKQQAEEYQSESTNPDQSKPLHYWHQALGWRHLQQSIELLETHEAKWKDAQQTRKDAEHNLQECEHRLDDAKDVYDTALKTYEQYHSLPTSEEKQSFFFQKSAKATPPSVLATAAEHDLQETQAKWEQAQEQVRKAQFHLQKCSTLVKIQEVAWYKQVHLVQQGLERKKQVLATATAAHTNDGKGSAFSNLSSVLRSRELAQLLSSRPTAASSSETTTTTPKNHTNATSTTTTTLLLTETLDRLQSLAIDLEARATELQQRTDALMAWGSAQVAADEGDMDECDWQ